MEFISQVISAEVVLISTIVKSLRVALMALVGLIVGSLLVSVLLTAPALIVVVALAEYGRQRLFGIVSPLGQEQEDSVDLDHEILAIREITQDSLESLQVNLGEDLVTAQIVAFDWSREPLKIDSSYWTDDVNYVDSFRSVDPVSVVEVTGEEKTEVSVVVAVLAWKDLCTMAKSHGIKVVGKGRNRSVIESELTKILLGKK